MKRKILLGTLVVSLMILGAFLVSAQLDTEDTTGEITNEPEISAKVSSCGQGSCGTSCDQSCGGSCGIKTCGCGR